MIQMCVTLMNLYIWPAGQVELCYGRIGLTDFKECTLILLKQVDSLFSCRALCLSGTHAQMLEDRPAGFTEVGAAISQVTEAVII